MNDYIALRINCNPCNENVTDLLAAFLADLGFESFEADNTGLTAYICASDFNEEKLITVFEDFPMKTEFSWRSELIKGKDWNEEWEKNYFKPILVDGKCVVHSSFHETFPEAEYEIVIDPKMAFGTGHHATTCNMIRFLLTSDLSEKNVIDVGTGTGILAILSKMRGAKNVDAIEIDNPAYENALENIAMNKVEINLICGDAKNLKRLNPADFILANINRNVILNDLPRYAEKLKNDGTIFLSGFYEEDIPLILMEAKKLSLDIVNKKKEGDWVALALKRNL